MLAEKTAVLEKVKTIIAKIKEGDVAIETITEESTFEQLGLDSLDLMEIRFDLEAAWDATITDEQAQQLRSVADIVRLVSEPKSVE